MFKQQEFDLIKQTQKNLQDKKGKYTINFLFDCMKIFFIPQRKWLKKLPIINIDKESWGIAPRNIKVCKAYHKDGVDISTVKDDYSVRNVARHIHNSVIHYLVLYYPLSGDIEMIKFMDWNFDRVDFELEVSVDNYKVFLLKFLQEISQ